MIVSLRFTDLSLGPFEEAFRHYVPEDSGKSSWLRTRLASTAPGSSIVDLAKERGSDLIVMGAHPASSMATHLRPGTAAKVLIEAPCPVLTLLVWCVTCNIVYVAWLIQPESRNDVRRPYLGRFLRDDSTALQPVFLQVVKGRPTVAPHISRKTSEIWATRPAALFSIRISYRPITEALIRRS